MSPRKDIAVPSGTIARPGFDVRRSEHGIAISVGAVNENPSVFGIARDDYGVSVGAWPVQLTEILSRLKTQVLFEYADRMYSLRGDCTVQELATPSGTPIRTVCVDVNVQFWFSYSTLYPYPYIMDLSSKGIGFLSHGYYRLTIKWYSYAVDALCHSYNALDVKDFTVTEGSYITYIPTFYKHDNKTAPEW